LVGELVLSQASLFPDLADSFSSTSHQIKSSNSFNSQVVILVIHFSELCGQIARNILGIDSRCVIRYNRYSS
jgi:hypothetical protein